MIEKAEKPEQESAGHAALRDHPTKLFVETTWHCNLACFMCVKQTGEGCSAEGDLTPKMFAALEPAFSHLEALILNGIGEPLLHPHLEDFIRQAKRSMSDTGWVGFQSNGLLLDAARALSLAEAEQQQLFLDLKNFSLSTLPGSTRSRAFSTRQARWQGGPAGKIITRSPDGCASSP